MKSQCILWLSPGLPPVTRIDKLAAAQADFTSRGMLHKSCLGEALQALQCELSTQFISNPDDEDKSGGLDGNRETGGNLDLNDNSNNDNDNGLPGPVAGPPVLSKVALEQKRGKPALYSRANGFNTHPPAPKYPYASFQALGDHIDQANLNVLI
jgi:hypothetical protein